MSAPLYVCVRIVEFAAQALVRLRPDYRKVPVAVMDGTPPLETVCSLNRMAGAMGVQHGMSRAELESFSKIHVLRRCVTSENSARAALLESLSVFTPRMEEHREGKALALAMDMTGAQRMFGSPAAIGRRVMQCVRQTGFAARIGTSGNLMCALCASRSFGGSLLIVPSGEEARFLATLPLDVLGLSEELGGTFAMWGLRSAGELAALPEHEVASRLGEEGRRLRLLARGEHPHLLVPIEPEFRLHEHAEFDSPVELLDSLLFVLASMLAQIVMRAQSRALSLASVSICLTLEGEGQHARAVRPALPSADRQALLKLIHLDLQAHPPPAGVLGMDVTAEPGIRSKVQEGLFSPVSPEAMRLDVMLARIAAVVGEDRVGRAQLLNSHRPDSFAMEKFTARQAADHKQDEGRNDAIGLRRMRPPQPVQVHGNGGSMESMHLRGERFRIHRAFGPWRLSGQWWSPDVWSYEEWDVAAESPGGERLVCLLAHDLHRSEWSMVALYD